MRLKIEQDGAMGHGARIWIDGELRHDVRSCTVWWSHDDITTATVEFIVSGLDCEVSRRA